MVNDAFINIESMTSVMHTWIDPLGIKLTVVGEGAGGYDISV
jgi:hypothetical protein